METATREPALVVAAVAAKDRKEHPQEYDNLKLNPDQHGRTPGERRQVVRS